MLPSPSVPFTIIIHRHARLPCLLIMMKIPDSKKALRCNTTWYLQERESAFTQRLRFQIKEKCLMMTVRKRHAWKQNAQSMRFYLL